MKKKLSNKTRVPIKTSQTIEETDIKKSKIEKGLMNLLTILKKKTV